MQRSWITFLAALILVCMANAGSAQTKSAQDARPSAPATVGNAPAPGATATPSAAAPDDDDDSPDIPPMARGRVNEREYLRLRDQQVGMKRGVDDLARNPQARSQAIRKMEVQEQALRQRQAAAAKAAGGAVIPLGPLTWTFLGPDPIPNGQTITTTVPVSGRVTAIAIDPTDSAGNTVYVGTAQGGLYRSLDGGSTWTALMDSAQSLAIGALTLDPTDHTILFVGTGEGNSSLDSFFGVGLYIITGANVGTGTLNGPFNEPTTFPNPNPDGFTDVFTGRSITKVLVNPGNHSQILVSTSSGFSGASGDSLPTRPTRGVYLSTSVFSGGAVGTPTFSRLTIQSASANDLVSDMVMDPGNPNLVLVHVFGNAVAGDGGVWASPSTVWAATGTWTQTFIDNDNSGAGTSADNAKFAAFRSGGGSPTTTFLLALDQIVSATSTVCPGKEGTLFQAANNGGSHWTEIPAARGFCGGQCFYDMPVAVDPTTLNNIYIGGQSGSGIGSCGSGPFGKSTNAGTSFSASEGSLHADAHAIAIHPTVPSIIYTGNDGGIFLSKDSGATWTSLNNPGFTATQFESIAVHPTDPNFTIGGTQDNGTPFLKPDGVTWTRADFGDGGFSAIDQNATDTTNVTMYHTYFNVSPTQIGFAQVTSVANAQDGGWNFFGCPASIGATLNGITCSDTVLFYAPLALGPGNPSTVYFGTDRLYRSTNQGATMTVVSQAPLVANVPISAVGISPLTDNVRIVGLGSDATTNTPNGHVFATTTGSSTLTDVTGPWIPKYIARAVIDPNNPNTGYVTLDGYGATTGHVWKTTNLSAATPTWTSMSSGIPDVPVNGFVVDPLNSNNLYAGTDIGVYNSTDGGNTWNPFGAGLPRVAVFDLKVTAKRTVRIATHGRGMWEAAAVPAGLGASVSLSFSPASPSVGTNVTFTAKVTPVSPGTTPTGTVAFVDLNGAGLGASPLDGTGTATLSATSLSAGNHLVVAVYAGDTLYAASESGNTPVTVSSADFSVTIPGGSVTVPPGQPAAYTINVGALNGFTGTVSFTCTSGLPSLTSCSFNPTSVTTAGSTTLTIATTAPTSTPPATGLGAGLGTTAGFFGLVLFGGLTARKRARRWLPAFLLPTVLALCGALVSCGGGGPPVVHNPGTPPGTSTVTITATSGNTTHTATVTLVVQ
ncbi:MAG TPA: Ig-like domain repeat protein [Candidatus Angelobacter sp.]